MAASGYGAEIDELPVRFEDATVLVVDKPSGLLSQPGIQVHDSVSRRVQQARPDARGPLLVHRLDMDTSGLLLLAKTAAAHAALQKEFRERRVTKQYRCVVGSPVAASGGLIELPLRLDVDRRPHQIVCRQHGKPSCTVWRADPADRLRRTLLLYPMTGRTHQLRVHLASPEGLDAPIVGDRLYGTPAERLLLHAERLGFRHPVDGRWQEVFSRAPF